MSIISEKIKSAFNEYIIPTYAPKMVFDHGAGSYLFDTDGNKYLDFATGISVCNLGHCHHKVSSAIAGQAAKLIHVSNIYMNTVAAPLAEKMVNMGFDGKVFFCNSGAEANEGLIKIARKWGNQSGRNKIIVMDNSFHGRTLATLAATGRSKYREGFSPDMPGFVHVEFNNLDAVKSAYTADVCAVMLEPVQGEGGLLPADEQYLHNLREFCNEKNILLLFDEVQCGIGRMGTFFAHQSFGVTPDAFSMAKALGNGVPIGAFMAKRFLADLLIVGTHGTTFGGTALAAAAATAVIDAYKEENIENNVQEMSKYLFTQLKLLTAEYGFAIGVRGRGLMIGVVLDTPAAPLQEILMNYGLITLTAGETVLRLLPPLNVSKAECDEALAIIKKGLAKFAAVKKETI